MRGPEYTETCNLKPQAKSEGARASFCGECSQTAWHLHLRENFQSLLLDGLQDPGPSAENTAAHRHQTCPLMAWLAKFAKAFT